MTKYKGQTPIEKCMKIIYYLILHQIKVCIEILLKKIWHCPNTFIMLRY